jgi:hypothetical protein
MKLKSMPPAGVTPEKTLFSKGRIDALTDRIAIDFSVRPALKTKTGTEKILAKMEKNPKTVRRVKELLFDKNPKVRESAAIALSAAAFFKIGIDDAVPALSACLGTEGESFRSLREISATALHNAAINGADIRCAEPGLSKMLQNAAPEAVYTVSVALIYSTSDTLKIERALRAIEKNFRASGILFTSGAIDALAEALRKGVSSYWAVLDLILELMADKEYFNASKLKALEHMSQSGLVRGPEVDLLFSTATGKDVKARQKASDLLEKLMPWLDYGVFMLIASQAQSLVSSANFYSEAEKNSPWFTDVSAKIGGIFLRLGERMRGQEGVA